VAAVEWLQKIFIPSINTSEPRLLILDGYGSHETTRSRGILLT
jgi:hypothetical protein